MNKTEKKLLGVMKRKIEGVVFEVSKVTPDDFLDKPGLPISKWQMESDKMFEHKRDSDMTMAEIQKSWKRLFIKAIVCIDGQYEDLEPLIDKVIKNFSLSNKLYNEIISHCFEYKKKIKVLDIFQRHKL